ncbi:MAG: hypothetical protein QM765_52105 [Myxococcales bacterium]
MSAPLVIGLLSALIASAAPEVPEPLRPWIGWAMQGREQARCTLLEGQETSGAPARRCAWPSRLTLSVDERGGRFVQAWHLEAPLAVPLPGGPKRWPVAVKVDGVPAVLIPFGSAGGPGALLAAGDHQLTGEFTWDSLPESLPVPVETGLLSLTVRNAAVPMPTREADGAVVLQRRTESETEPSTDGDRLEVNVFRLVADEVPMRLVTRVELRVSGKSREVLLGRTLPQSFLASALDSPLPARLNADGRLRVQVRPGTWLLTLEARSEGPVSTLTRHAPDGTWSDDGGELWVFDARPALREVALEGVELIDPNQTELPADWKKLPAFPMAVGGALSLVEQRRGDSAPPADQLHLRRELWLDFDGGGYTVRDSITGTAPRAWRLELPAPGILGRTSVNGEDLLITRLDAGAPGVELPQPEGGPERRQPPGGQRRGPARSRLGRGLPVGHLDHPPAARLAARLCQRGRRGHAHLARLVLLARPVAGPGRRARRVAPARPRLGAVDLRRAAPDGGRAVRPRLDVALRPGRRRAGARPARGLLAHRCSWREDRAARGPVSRDRDLRRRAAADGALPDGGQGSLGEHRAGAVGPGLAARGLRRRGGRGRLVHPPARPRRESRQEVSLGGVLHRGRGADHDLRSRRHHHLRPQPAGALRGLGQRPRRRGRQREQRRQRGLRLHDEAQGHPQLRRQQLQLQRGRSDRPRHPHLGALQHHRVPQVARPHPVLAARAPVPARPGRQRRARLRAQRAGRPAPPGPPALPRPVLARAAQGVRPTARARSQGRGAHPRPRARPRRPVDRLGADPEPRDARRAGQAAHGAARLRSALRRQSAADARGRTRDLHPAPRALRRRCDLHPAPGLGCRPGAERGAARRPPCARARPQ